MTPSLTNVQSSVKWRIEDFGLAVYTFPDAGLSKYQRKLVSRPFEFRIAHVGILYYVYALH